MKQDFLYKIEANQNIIHKVSRMYRNTKEDREDLFQDIVFQLWKAYPKFRNESKFSTWMYRIALNTAIAVYRKNTIQVDYKEHIPEQLQPSSKNEQSQNEERMYWALRQLNAAEKAIISLYLEDYSYEEIAEITGITENYVGVRINHKKNKLRIILKT